MNWAMFLICALLGGAGGYLVAGFAVGLYKPTPRMPRKWHRRYADRHGYFWLPCPLRGKPSGGHEWRRYRGRPDSVPDPEYPPGSGRSVGICPRCTRAGRGHDIPADQLPVYYLDEEAS